MYQFAKTTNDQVSNSSEKFDISTPDDVTMNCEKMTKFLSKEL